MSIEKNHQNSDKNYHIVPLSEPQLFTDETIESLVEFGNVLRRIHNRLISEGYTIVDGKITKPKVIKF